MIKNSKKVFIFSILVIFLIIVGLKCFGIFNNQDKICRVQGCENKAVYSEYEKRFCLKHLKTNSDKKSNEPTPVKQVNYEKALTKEEGKALIGTGYHGTIPDSNAELMAIKADMNQCKRCGMKTKNGVNSLCDACKHNEKYGLD